MFVVNTTSATVGLVVSVASSPRKRVPSSRRRNPGRVSRSVTLVLWLLVRRWLRGRRRLLSTGLWRSGVWRRSRRRATRCRRRRVRWIRRRERNWIGAAGCTNRRGCRRRRLEGLIEHRLWCAAPSRRNREQEREAEEQPSAPPACLGEEVAGLSRAEERARRTAHATERRRH